MAEISSYARGRLNTTHMRVARELIEDVRDSRVLSEEFKEGFRVSMSAKHQTPTLIIPKTTERELGRFEYEVLGNWADNNHIGWEWADERDTYIVVDWRAI